MTLTIREAASPPEARGVARDGVRLLVARSRRPLRHARFTDLPAAWFAPELPGEITVPVLGLHGQADPIRSAVPVL